MPRLTARSIGSLLAALRSPEPTPGGGSASALAGALGTSLLAMVSALPTSRATSEEDAQRLHAAGERCSSLAGDLEALVDRDSDAYDLVLQAYRRPKGRDDENAARAAAIQTALREAIASPLDVMRACAAAAEQGVVVAALGSPSAASDVLVGLELIGAGLRGAGFNVEINLERVRDAAFVGAVRREEAELERAVGHESAAARRALQRG